MAHGVVIKFLLDTAYVFRPVSVEHYKMNRAVIKRIPFFGAGCHATNLGVGGQTEYGKIRNGRLRGRGIVIMVARNREQHRIFHQPALISLKKVSLVVRVIAIIRVIADERPEVGGRVSPETRECVAHLCLVVSNNIITAITKSHHPDFTGSIGGWCRQKIIIRPLLQYLRGRTNTVKILAVGG